MPFLIFTCDRCDTTWNSTILWGRCSYEAPTRLIGIERDIGWCVSCRTLAPVEILPNEEEIQAMAADLEEKAEFVRDQKMRAMQQRSWVGRVFNVSPKLSEELRDVEFEVEMMEEALREANERISLLRNRTSKARCLRCGTTDFQRLSFDIEPLDLFEQPGPPVLTEVLHPGCGGHLVVQHSDYRLNMQLSHRIYDVEGRLLREEEET